MSFVKRPKANGKAWSVESLEPRHLMAGDLILPHSTDTLHADTVSSGHSHSNVHALGDFYRPPTTFQSPIAVDNETLVARPIDSDRQPLDIALDFLRTNADQFGLNANDVESFRISDLYQSDHNGVTHVYLRQQHNGLDVINADINVNVMANGNRTNGWQFLCHRASLVAKRTRYHVRWGYHVR